jgi:hypothetical protein
MFVEAKKKNDYYALVTSFLAHERKRIYKDILNAVNKELEED